VAQKYGMECLLHEKPFAGVNGSGKHVNWSLGNATQGNLLDPGDTPHENAQFLVFCAAVIRAVHKHAGPAARGGRLGGQRPPLGANEAPPAIISIFLGDQLTDVFEQIKPRAAPRSRRRPGTLTVGVDTLPPLPKDAGDRNRTSPFAFTGNRFEFRAVGSNQSIAGPLVAMNTIVAESLDYMRHGSSRSHRGDPKKLNAARPEAAQGDHQGARLDHLQRRRLLRGVAQGSGEARPAEIEAAHGLSPRAGSGGVRYRLGEGVTGTVIQTGKPGRAAAHERKRRAEAFSTAPAAASRPDTSFICVPITVGKEVVGALSVDQAAYDPRPRCARTRGC
jgi:hypothetical protein